jgi:hypothetical protein
MAVVRTQEVHLFTVDIEKHSMGVGLRSWPTNLDYNSKDSASVVTYGQDLPAGDLETRCSADSIQRMKPGGGSGAEPPGQQHLAPDAPRAAAAVSRLALAQGTHAGAPKVLACIVPRDPFLTLLLHLRLSCLPHS